MSSGTIATIPPIPGRCATAWITKPVAQPSSSANVTGTITLTHGTLDIKKNLDIIGPGAANLTISGDNKSRVFLVADDVKANISSLTISRGKSGAGGGVVNQGNLTLSSCIVSDNNALYGGGLYNYSPFGAKLHLSNCAFTRNTAAWGGGMATLEGQRETVFDDCTFSDNSAYSEQGGGGLLLNGFVRLVNCTITNNTAADGLGGGLKRNQGDQCVLQNCTISGNSAATGGGLYNNDFDSKNRFDLINTIVAGNTDTSQSRTASDIVGKVAGRNNLIGPGGSGGLENGASGNNVLESLTGLGLGSLGSYGGPTQTIPLLPGSPAIGNGVFTTGLVADQRGVLRPSSSIDIGAIRTAASQSRPARAVARRASWSTRHSPIRWPPLWSAPMATRSSGA